MIYFSAVVLQLFQKQTLDFTIQNITNENRGPEARGWGRLSTDERQLPSSHFVSFVAKAGNLFFTMAGDQNGFAFLL